jgi:BRCT domain type II-containing protein
LAGGNVQGSVTSKTRYLIAGANTGAAKTSKARELGTEVIDEAKLLELLGNVMVNQDAVETTKPQTPSPAVLEQGFLF